MLCFVLKICVLMDFNPLKDFLTKLPSKGNFYSKKSPLLLTTSRITNCSIMAQNHEPNNVGSVKSLVLLSKSD